MNMDNKPLSVEGEWVLVRREVVQRASRLLTGAAMYSHNSVNVEAINETVAALSPSRYAPAVPVGYTTDKDGSIVPGSVYETGDDEPYLAAGVAVDGMNDLERWNKCQDELSTLPADVYVTAHGTVCIDLEFDDTAFSLLVGREGVSAVYNQRIYRIGTMDDGAVRELRDAVATKQEQIGLLP